MGTCLAPSPSHCVLDCCCIQLGLVPVVPRALDLDVAGTLTVVLAKHHLLASHSAVLCCAAQGCLCAMRALHCESQMMP